MPSTILISARNLSRCAKKTSPTSQTPTNWIDVMREARNKHCPPHPKAVPSAEDRTATGPAKAHHLNHGRTAVDTAARKIGAHRASTDQEVGMTAANHHTNTALHHPHHQASADRTGVMAQIEGITISPLHHQMADTRFRPFLATAPTAVIEAVAVDQLLPPATHTSLATVQTTALVDPGNLMVEAANPMGEPAVEVAIQATHEKVEEATPMTAPVHTGTAIAEIPGVMEGGEMDALGVEVQNAEIGIGIEVGTAEMILIVGDDSLVVVVRGRAKGGTRLGTTPVREW
jgi:hypothetical protein